MSFYEGQRVVYTGRPEPVDGIAPGDAGTVVDVLADEDGEPADVSVCFDDGPAIAFNVPIGVSSSDFRWEIEPLDARDD